MLEATFVVRTLRPFHANIAKRQVKAPMVYVSDSGWEGFLIETVVAQLGCRRDQCCFWGTYAGAELDLLVVDGSRRLGFEFKRTTAPRVAPSMRSALADLRLDRLDVIHAGEATFALGKRVRAVAAGRVTIEL